jgi:predicted DNA-binding transcriptional regulator YafY
MEAKNHLERLLYMDEAIRAGGYPSKKRFADHFEVSAKTIERDFEYMKYRLGAPLEYSREHNGYYYSKDHFFLPSLALSEEEIYALGLAVQTVNGLGNSKITGNLKNGLNKIFRFLPEKTQTQLEKILKRSIYIGSPPVKTVKGVWETVLKAIIEDKQIRIKYQVRKYSENIERLLNPYYLLANNGSWYVMAYNPVRKNVETYSLHKISRITITKGTFSIPKTFDPFDYVDRHWGIYSSNKVYNVEIHFSREAAQYIKNMEWPQDFELAETTFAAPDSPDAASTAAELDQKDQDSLTLRFKTSQLLQVKHWVMKWGENAQVAAPLELREIIAESVSRMHRIYNRDKKEQHHP